VTSQSRYGPFPATVRATGNLALTACGILLVLDLFTPRQPIELASIILAITGVGLRIEASIRDGRTTGS
jgi:hypothetical protein